MNEWKNILPTDSSITEEQLMQYLAGNASDELRFEIEKQMADSAFLDDAIEGLQQYDSPAALTALKSQLNSQLKKAMAPKLKRRKRKVFEDQYWLIYAILGILLLCVIGYLIIHFYGNK
jgi:predicted permease